MADALPTTERAAWLARYTSKVAEKAEGMPDSKNSAEIARANRELVAACLALIAVRELCDRVQADDTPLYLDELRAIVGPSSGGGR